MLDFLELAICSFSLWDQRPDTTAHLCLWFTGLYISHIQKYAFHRDGGYYDLHKGDLWVSFPHLYLVLWPCPQETLHDAQLDQELQMQEAWQLWLVQRSCPSEQLQLLQSTWCQLPAAQICPSESTQSHCHSCTHTPSCCNWPGHTNTLVI